MEEFISTTLIAYNRLEYTQKTIESYLASTVVPHELIVVDNGSTDETLKYLEQLGAEKKIKGLISNSVNKYPAFATNQGWMNASPKTTLLHRSDNDLLYKKGWDLEVIQAFKDIPKMGQLGIVNELYQVPPNARKEYLKAQIKIGKTNVMPPPNGWKNVGGPCVIKQEIFFDKKVRWPEDYWIGERNEDAKYSDLVRDAGYEIYELVSEKVVHVGFGDFQKYMDYYLETYSQRNLHGFFTQRLKFERDGKIKDFKLTEL